MVTALQDLRNRIASNTLTGPQQTALDTALDVLIPLFPTPDELSNSIPVGEEVLAREWIAPLYTLQALAGPGGGVLPTTETAFFVNALTGSDTNDGLTPSTPLATIAALGALWRGTAGGGRPVLAPATGTTVTVTLQTDMPLSDPLAPILDVDITGGASLIIQANNRAPLHTGTIATANAWARTVANGQVRITDAAVPDYGVFVPEASLFEDDTATSVAWLYGPDTGSSATGTMTVAYQPQTAGVASIPTQSNVTAADAYTLRNPFVVALGNGFVTRSFPADGSGSVAEASVFFYRLRLTNPGTNPVAQVQSVTASYNMQECMYDTLEIQVGIGGFSAVNCFGYHTLGIVAQAGSFVELFAGGISGQASGTAQAAAGGTMIVDGDFALFSGSSVHRGRSRADAHGQRGPLEQRRKPGAQRRRRDARRRAGLSGGRRGLRHRRGRRLRHHEQPGRQRGRHPLRQRRRRHARGRRVQVHRHGVHQRHAGRVGLRPQPDHRPGRRADHEHARPPGRRDRRRDGLRRRGGRPAQRQHVPNRHLSARDFASRSTYAMAVEEQDKETRPDTMRPRDAGLPVTPPGGIERRYPRGTPLQRLIARQDEQRKAAARDTEPPGH